MYKLFKIAKDNMKKQKGDMITFLVLTFISAFLLFDCVSAMIGIGKVMETTFDDINGPHVMLYCGRSDEETEAAEKVFEANDKIVEYEATPFTMISCQYRKKGEKEFMDYMFFSEAFEEEKNIMDIKKPVSSLKKNEILLPYNMHNSFAEGDVIQLKFDDDIYDFNVVGYLADPYFCSTVNITCYSVCMSQEMLDELEENYPNIALKSMAHKGRVDNMEYKSGNIDTTKLEKEIGDAFKTEVTKLAKNNPEKNYTNYLLMNWQLMKAGSQIVPQIVLGVMVMFALIIMVISIVIISFSVNNFIQKNMKNTGILEASGYTVSELRWALTLQIVLIGLIGSIAGVGVGILTFNGFGQIVASVVGLAWIQPVDWTIAAVVVISIVIVLGLVARLISRKYKKITVLDALRGGITTHNFKKNFFSFENTPLPIPVTMALKDIFGGFGRNLIMVFISAILTISMLVGFGFMENFGKDPNVMLHMFGFEMVTVGVADDDYNSDYKKVAADIEGLESVDKVFTVAGVEPVLKFGDKEQTIYAFAADDMNKSTNTVILEGRHQEKDNEIMVTSAIAKDFGLKLGDVVTLSYADEEAEYIIVGINQRIERSGRSAYMTIDGAKRIVPGNMSYTYDTTAKDGKSFDDVVKDLNKLEKEKGYSFSSTNIEKMMSGTMGSIILSVNLICVLVTIITILIVIFVESLVIRAKISREWKGMGISKAIGQTSGDLISQIMFSNIPSIFAGTLIGALIAPAIGKIGIEAAFSMFVIKNAPFNIPAYYILITIVVIVLVAILTSAAAGLKVRKLKPVEMITEE